MGDLDYIFLDQNVLFLSGYFHAWFLPLYIQYCMCLTLDLSREGDACFRFSQRGRLMLHNYTTKHTSSPVLIIVFI